MTGAPSEGYLTIPVPTIAPLGIPLSAMGVLDVWDTFVKPEQDAGVPQSVEMRALMAILRAVYQGYQGHPVTGSGEA